MSGTTTRRTALRGCVAASVGFLAGVDAAQAVPTLSANDRRLVELADAYFKLNAAVNVLHSTAAGYDDLVAGFQPIEEEMARTQADTIVGILAKARACQLSVLRDCEEPVSLSVADDVWRLFGGGADA